MTAGRHTQMTAVGAADGEWALTSILPRETGRSAARSIRDPPRDEVERVVPGIGWQTVR